MAQRQVVASTRPSTVWHDPTRVTLSSRDLRTPRQGRRLRAVGGASTSATQVLLLSSIYPATRDLLSAVRTQGLGAGPTSCGGRNTRDHLRPAVGAPETGNYRLPPHGRLARCPYGAFGSTTPSTPVTRNPGVQRSATAPLFNEPQHNRQERQSGCIRPTPRVVRFDMGAVRGAFGRRDVSSLWVTWQKDVEPLPADRE